MDEEMNGADIYLAQETNENAEEKVLTLGEITELREEDCKVFAMSDGTLQAVFYPNAVHAFDQQTGTFEEANSTASQTAKVRPVQSTAMVNRADSIITYSWSEGNMSSDTVHTVGLLSGSNGVGCANRMYIKLSMPTLPRNPRIKKAELKFTQIWNSN